MTGAIGVILACLVASPTTCERHEFRVVDARICRLPGYVESIPVGGAWQDARFTVTCGSRQ